MGGERGSEKPRGASGALSPAERRQQRQRERREKKAREKNAAAGALRRAVSKRPASSGSARVSSVKRTRKESSSGSDDDENDGTGDESGEDTGEDGAGEDAVERTGAYGSYGRSDGRMSVEDDEWATAPRTWAALAPYLSHYHDRKIWAPFYYDGAAGKRLEDAGFKRVVHKREDFFKRINDRVFVKSVAAVVDNPPYTGKGMKEKVLRALVDADVPFCLLLPLGVLHTATVREILNVDEVQALIPRRCWVSKRGQKEVPFKYLVWLCYKMNLPRDLVLMPDTETATDGDGDTAGDDATPATRGSKPNSEGTTPGSSGRSVEKGKRGGWRPGAGRPPKPVDPNDPTPSKRRRRLPGEPPRKRGRPRKISTLEDT